MERNTFTLIAIIVLALTYMAFLGFQIHDLKEENEQRVEKAKERIDELEKIEERIITGIEVRLDTPREDMIIKNIPNNKYLKEIYTDEGVYIVEHNNDGDIINIIESKEKYDEVG